MPSFIRQLFLSASLLLGCMSASAQLSWNYSSEAGTPAYSIYNADDHGGGAITCDIAEDKHGNLFFANEAGLLKFDGVRWTRMPETGRAYYTTAVTIDSQDRIWILGIKHVGYYEANASGTYHYTDITDTVQTLPMASDLGMFWKLYADENQIYLISSFYVLRWDGKTWKVWPRFDEKRRILPTWLDGNLYIYARGSGLFQLLDDEFTLIADETEAVASGIISIPSASEQQGLLCVTIKNGFFYLKNGQFTAVPSEALPSLQQINVIHSIQSDNENLLLATLSEGILLLNKEGEIIYQITDAGMVNSRVMIDSSGSAWITSSNEIIQIKDLPVTHYADAAHDIVRHRDTLYYTNLSELKTVAHSDLNLSKAPSHTFPAAGTWDLLSVGPDLLAGNAFGLSVLTDGAGQVEIPHPRSLMCLFPSPSDPSVIYSFDPPKLGRWQKDAGKWQFIDTLEGLQHIIFSLIELPNGNLLLAGENGPILYADWPPLGSHAKATITELGDAQGLPNQFNWAYCLRINETVVVVSDVGLFRYDLNTQMFTYDAVLGDDLGQDVYGLEVCPLADHDGWLLHLPSTNSDEFRTGQIGALRIRTDQTLVWEPWQLPSVAQVGKVEALLHEKINDQETLWVGGSKDLLRYDLSALKIPPLPTVRLTAITETNSNRSYYRGAGDIPDEIEWNFPQKSLHFEFAALPSALQVLGYQTRLLGFEENWSNTSELTFRNYTNLQEGSYQFEVRTIDELGREGSTYLQNFTIRPPLYRTWYAYLGFIITTFILIALSVRWWTLRLRKRNEMLEAMVNQRTIDLERRQVELIEANNVKQDFLANMSHEIRNPLNGILGITRLMREDQQSERTTHLYSCAKHLHQLLGQTLDYSSLEAGKLSLHPQAFSPTNLVHEVIGMHQGLLDEKGLALQTEIPEVPHDWLGDPVLLRQILINLISNAVKYTNDGYVKVKLSYGTTGSEVSARFEVHDSGPGIPADKQDYIFEKFTRLSKAGESQVSGTGLGLAIASEMASLMKGTLTLDTQVDRGACFVLTLPLELVVRNTSSPATVKRTDNKPLNGRLVLIADDMDFNRYINKEVLQKMGATVHETKDGIHALQALKTMHFDFAILDINMPGLSGIEVVRSALADNAPLPPKFVALSAHTTPKMQASCLAAGFEYFIEKPLTPEKLKSLIASSVENIPSQPKAALDDSLLNYLAGNDPTAIAALEVRYQTSLINGIDHLQQTFDSDDRDAQRSAVHKLKGLTNFKKDTTLSELLNHLSQFIAADASAKNCTTICLKIRAHIAHSQPNE